MNFLKIILFVFFVSVFYTAVSQTISKTVDMSFGNIAVSGPGTVVINPNGSRGCTGGITLPGLTGTVTAASFDVSGTALHTYSITLPVIGSSISSGGNTMTVDTFTSDPSITGTLSAGGTQQLKIGATLHVNGAQASGTYTSGSTFAVTINYN